MKRTSCALALVFVLAPLGGAHGKYLPQLAPRQLVVFSNAVVRAAVLEDSAPKQFRILEVMRGGLHAGDTLALDDLGPHDLRVHEENLPDGQKPPRRRIAEALLFLGPADGKGARQPVFSGLRFRTEGGEVLAPRQFENPGPYLLAVQPEADWDALLRQVRADCLAHDRLLAARGLARPGSRCRALLEWVERHRTDFGSPTHGWGHLEQDVFQWVLASGDREECWEAVRRYAELNRGAVPPLPAPAFARPGGRDGLLRVALSDARLEGDRVRALVVLAHPHTLWSETPGTAARPLTGKEQEDLIDGLVPLLKAKSAAIRAAAARALNAASAPREHQTQRALGALTAAYRAEPPGPARDEIAAATYAIGGPAHWQEVSGNPRGLFARLHDFGHRDGKVFFWLHLETGGLAVHECPTLLLEWLDPRRGSGVAERKEQPLPVVNLRRPWNEGWDGNTYLLVEVPTGALGEGTWRVTVRGTAGKDGDKVKWAAEPRTFAVKLPAPGAQPEVISTDW